MGRPQSVRPVPPSTELLVWHITWVQAFPTLLPCLCNFMMEEDPVWQLLAYTCLFPDTRQQLLLAGGVLDGEQYQSKHKRDKESFNENLGYGEITIPAVMEILKQINKGNDLPNDATVMDLGSGNGKVLLAACLAQDFSKVIGIEIVDDLHLEALSNWNEWKHWQVYSRLRPSVDLKCSDFTKHADLIATADVVFVHATVFSDALFERVQELCQSCALGTYFVMVTKPLEERGGIKTLESMGLHMNWGMANVFIQRKVKEL